jgi:hypothetical protein
MAEATITKGDEENVAWKPGMAPPEAHSRGLRAVITL